MFRISALALALLFATAAAAEEAPAGAPAQLGRVAAVSGTVTLRGTADAAAGEAAVNYPLTTGNRLATAPRSHAAVDIAAGRFHLDGDTALGIGALRPGMTAVSLERGAVILHILPGGAGQVFAIETPRGTLRADQPGYYEVAVIAETGQVVAAALEGGAQFDDAIVLSPGTRVSLSKGAAPLLDRAVEDDFIRRVAAEVRNAGENALAAPKYVSPQTTGYQELLRHGLWVMTERYGWVWEPQVMSDWAPFRAGRWVEIAPWGRTWIDDAPWGFAPSHYGRWTEANGRWVWIPGNAAPPPSDAPATVGFFGTPGQDGGAATAWVPLGPEEPVFSAAPVIVNNDVRVFSPPAPKVVNVTNVNNTTNVTNVVKPDRRPAVVLIPGYVPPPPPPPGPPPGPGGAGANLTGVGAAGTPIGAGVPFPGRR